MGIGFYMNDFISIFFPGKETILAYYGIILYYFMLDFLVRIALQELPTLSVQPYLTLNIRKKFIVNFLNFKTLFSFFNLIPLLLFFPYCFTGVVSHSGLLAAISIGICIVTLIGFNNFMSLWLKRLGDSREWVLLCGISIVLVFAVLDYLEAISVMDFSGYLFSAIVSKPYLAIAFIGLAMLAFMINKRFLLENFYIEELSTKVQEKVSTAYPLFTRFGRVGDLAAVEFKLLLRHKRSKSVVLMSSIFMFYGLIFYDYEVLEANQFGTPLVAAILIIGIFMISYGQFMFAWQSNHFDGLMANRIDNVDFIKSKFLLLTLAATIITMVSFLYGIISWKLILLHVCVYLYTIGFGSVIIIFFANYNTKRLDLSHGSMMNWQGMGITQWIIGIPIILLPFLIYLPFGLSGAPLQGLIAIGVFGLITLTMRHLWIKWLTQLFFKQRYKIAEGFRK